MLLESTFKAKHQRLRFPVYDRVYKALRDGGLDKPEACERCGRKTEYLDSHHPDYKKPFLVKFLCKSCHKLLHLGSKLPPKGSMDGVSGALNEARAFHEYGFGIKHAPHSTEVEYGGGRERRFKGKQIPKGMQKKGRYIRVRGFGKEVVADTRSGISIKNRPGFRSVIGTDYGSVS